MGGGHVAGGCAYGYQVETLSCGVPAPLPGLYGFYLSFTHGLWLASLRHGLSSAAPTGAFLDYHQLFPTGVFFVALLCRTILINLKERRGRFGG